MKLESVKDEAFREYGQIIEGFDFSALLRVLRETAPCPEDKIIYMADEGALEALPIFEDLKRDYYGGLPIQIGYCAGFGTKLNALEYHRDSELCIPADDIIIMLARQSEIEKPQWTLSSSKVRAFLAPAGTGLELYATTLHYAPAASSEKGFRNICVLPRGTNGPKPDIKIKGGENSLCLAANKWLIAHGEAKNEISNGAHVGLLGENPDARLLWR
ncbi:MAG: DUF4867 family protein [Treponema sp.]|nr:DUF4867 family protein [Treponema sp.]